MPFVASGVAMLREHRIRYFVVAALLGMCGAMAVLTCWLLWPEWQRYQAVRTFVNEVREEARLLSLNGDEAYVDNKIQEFAWRVHEVQSDAAASFALVPLLKDEDKNVRSKAAYALGWVDADPDVVSPLIESLADPDDDVRWWVAGALGRIGPNAAAALPALLEATDRNRFECQMALEAIAQIAPDSSEVIDRLIEALESSDSELRKTAAATLARIGPPAKQAVPILLRTLENRAVREEKGRTYGCFYHSSLGEVFTYALENIDPEAARKLASE